MVTTKPFVLTSHIKNTTGAHELESLEYINKMGTHIGPYALWYH